MKRSARPRKGEIEAVKKYTPFVWKLAKSYARAYGVEVEDLVQAGLLAVAKAFRTWKKSGGANFLTWIHGPVHWAMNRFVAEARGVPANKYRKRLPTTSLDAPIAVTENGIEVTLHDMIGTPDEHPDYFALKRLRWAMFHLDPRERTVIRMRFAQSLRLQDVADHFDLSRERVRQIEEEALGKLRTRMNAPPRKAAS